MVFKWRDNHTVLVLELLKNKECLWNTKSQDYRNRDCREKALENMVEMLNLPGLTTEDVKLKIKSIRSRYSSELAKVLQSEKSGADRDNVYKPKLFWFTQANLFLRSVCSPRLSTKCHMNTLEECVDNEGIESDVGTMSKEDTDTEPEEQEINFIGNVANAVKSENKREHLPENHQQIRKRKCETEPSFQEVNNAIDRLHQIFDECRGEEDEFDLFGRSLAVQLRKMPLHRALLCQEKLQRVMTEERIHNLTAHIQHTQSK